MADTRGLMCSSCILIVSLKRRARVDVSCCGFLRVGWWPAVWPPRVRPSLALGLVSRVQGRRSLASREVGPHPLQGPCSPVLRESRPAQAEHTPLTPSSKVSMQGGPCTWAWKPRFQLLGGRLTAEPGVGARPGCRLPPLRLWGPPCCRQSVVRPWLWPVGETVPKASSLGPGSDRAARCLTTKAGSMEGGEAGRKSSVSNRP